MKYSLLALFLLAAPSEDFPTSAGAARITPIQHASFLLEAGGKALYVDPAMGDYAGRPKADYILITDIHGDHLAPQIIDQIKQPATAMMGPQAVADKLAGVSVISNGEKKALGPFQVEAIPMYNLTRRSRNQTGKSVTMPEWASNY